jgi:glyoxylase-like metal-dependent hydrolase (beta-lactamase superfamily II)
MIEKISGNGLSRRDLLKGVGIGAAGLAVGGFASRVTRAQNTAAAPVSTYSFNVGALEVTVIRDAGGAFLPVSIFAPNVDAAERDAFLAERAIPVTDGNLSAVIQNLLVRSGDQYILFDTGNGAAGGGRLLDGLAQVGVTPEQINTVLLSHYHGDHINGFTDADNNLVFPNAQILVPQPEYDYLLSVGEGTPVSGGVDNALAKLEPALASEQIGFYNDEDEVVSGVQALFTPGHTPGHMAFLLNSDGSSLMASVDTSINAYIGLERPDWYVAFDTDPALAVESRRALFARAADEQLQVFGYHFPYPGVGYVVRDGDDAFRWLPAAY